MPTKDCSFCGREGILLYPVRYAIACPAGASQAPELSGNFRIENAPTQVATAKYTLRAVRTGYLYTYDEKRDRLKAYMVMPEGYLWNFPCDHPPRENKKPPAQCISPVETALSMCVDVAHSDSDPARVFWVGWSNSAWTPALIKKVKEDDWRRKHMRGIDIPWMLKGLRDVHVAEFEPNHKKIAHFAMSVKDMQKAFGFSNTPISHEMRRMNKADRFISAFATQSAVKKGFIVALDDPVGITNDLSELTVPSQHSGFNAELYRGRIIEDILQSAEAAVREQAGREFDFDVAQRKIDNENPQTDSVSYSDMKELMAVIKAGGPGKLARRRSADRQRLGNSVASQRKAAEERAWEELAIVDGKPVLDFGKRVQFSAAYKSAVAAYEEQGIAIEKSHAEWLTSDQLFKWMDGVHDDSDLASGFAYRESLAQCIGSAVATKACDKQLSAWLATADVSSISNMYARAMLFNQAEIINAAVAQIKGGDVKLKHLLSVYKQGADRLKKGQELRLIDRLIFTTTNTTVKALSQNTNAKMRNLVLISLTLLGKTVINTSTHTAHEIRNWMMSEAKKQGIQFTAGRTETRSDALRVGKKIIDSAPSNPAICAYELDVAQLESDGRISYGSLKAIRIPGYEMTNKWLASSAHFNVASVGTILQFVAFSFAVRDLKNSDSIDSKVFIAKLVAAAVSLTGSLVEVAGTVVEKSPSHPLSIAIHGHWSKVTSGSDKLLILGKRISVIGGVIVACADLYLSYRSFGEGKYLLSAMYAISGALSIFIAIAGYMGAIIFWPLFIAALILAVAIGLLKDSPISKWMQRCFFSKGFSSGTGYSTLEEELSELSSVLGG